MHSDSLIKNVTPFEDDTEILYIYTQFSNARSLFSSNQKILLLRWLHRPWQIVYAHVTYSKSKILQIVVPDYLLTSMLTNTILNHNIVSKINLQ